VEVRRGLDVAGAGRQAGIDFILNLTSAEKFSNTF
jgi:hypothetical protein